MEYIKTDVNRKITIDDCRCHTFKDDIHNNKPDEKNTDNTDPFICCLNTRIRLKWIVISLCIFTIILLISLLSRVIFWSIARTKAFDHKEIIVCLPCDELKWSGNEDLSEFEQKNVTDAGYMACCSVGSKLLDRLIEKHAVSKHRHLQQARLLGSLGDDCKGKEMNPQKPYVKMAGLNFTKITNDDGNIIHWNSTLHGGNVKPKHGNIFIKEPGFYYVLSSLKLLIPMKNYSIVHSHQLYIHSYYHGTLKRVLENSKSFCETTSDISETTSTIGGVFQLEKHDKLFIQSSHPQYLVSSEYSNGFAIYMM